MKISFSLLLVLMLSCCCIHAQMITGVWKGKINGKRVEVKIIKNGDSLTGTSYYYQSASRYSRYSIKGYFNHADNSAVWWDDALIEERPAKGLIKAPGTDAYISIADFNCPGTNKMFLNGNAALKENSEKIKGPVDLEKTDAAVFTDEWDYVIDNYTVGANDPYLIDSISQLAFKTPVEKTEDVPGLKANTTTVNKEKQPVTKPPPRPVKKEVITIRDKDQTPPVVVIAEIKKPIESITGKFTAREKVILKEIPVKADSIELKFYDNAEVDGDSISIFLNGHLLYEHVLLSDRPYIIKLAVTDLQQTNDLIMVAENLGSIPPNTAFMMCIVDDKHYETRMESTEQKSSGIRFIKALPTQ